ncbi:MAG: outer membrane beta-barrel domain-containing protein [Deltaproteobacteria bacterium]|nr:outer membrane beta-barrel domain-containing protein [Deltaproteobacteria bacterium]
MFLRFVVVALALSVAAPGARAQYDDEEGGGTAIVIQNRKFKMAHEFTLEGGVVPLDAFFKGITLTGRYTLHFDDFNAWEIGAASYSFNLDTGLKDQLINNFGVQAEALPTLLIIADSNYVMKPFYGKLALFNRTLLYAELFLVGGATVTYWSDGSFRPGPDFGAGFRFFVTEWMSIRTDIRHTIVFNGLPVVDPNSTIDGILYLGAGVSFNVGY